MPSLSLLAAFFATTFVFAYVPGPAMLYAAGQTLARGRKAGLMAALGIHLGCYAHVFAAAAGLSILFHAVPALYLVVKLAGAAYLVWLGFRMIVAKDQPAAEAGAMTSGRAALIESMLVEVLNPKTAIFFLAFLPQFVDAGAGFPVWLQLAILGSAVNLIFTSADIVCVLFAGLVTERLKRSSGAQKLMRRAGGTVLCGLGVNLALQRG
ncbi:LysE family translocator [Rhizobium sp. G21]|uniref:LysE family translocator n=1 Tax=Rhizobium sp. G21 TaxID=2758439 RepID=UPI0015FEED32|nr:LysE family translocator [Rhizobium sp. G21]MBB1248275.1 LysE family translocator [Rhizobium sp. G21]